MKKCLSFLLVLIFLMTLLGCNKNKSQVNTQYYFNASILEISANSMKLKCTESLNSSIPVDEEFLVSTDVVSATGVPEIVVGDSIHVVFNGEVMETYPLQIGTVFSIYLLDENGKVITNN